jgi:hypothetical protein
MKNKLTKKYLILLLIVYSNGFLSFSQTSDSLVNHLDSNLIYCYCDSTMLENSGGWLYSKNWELKSIYYTDTLTLAEHVEFTTSLLYQFDSLNVKFFTPDINDYYIQATPVFNSLDSSKVFVFGIIFHKSSMHTPEILHNEIRRVFDGSMTITRFVYADNKIYFYW